MAMVAAFSPETGRGVTLLNTGDPAVNTTEPTGGLAGSGWQFEGTWGVFLGTPIAPNFSISAAHIGRAGTVFSFRDASYTIVRSYPVPDTDLLIWQVAETFPAVAPLYTRRDEISRPLVVIGRGTDRGVQVMLNNQLRGWQWGAGNQVQRWGENVVAGVSPNDSPRNLLLYATFDQPGLANESHLSSGDSGGAIFLNDNGIWKLAGINYAVDGPFYLDANGSGEFNAALTDARGFFYKSGSNFVEITDANLVPTGFYATAISRQIAAIYSIIDPASDPDGDGIPNLLEYGLNSNPLMQDSVGLPKISRESDNLTLTYNQRASATDVSFLVEKSNDLISWSPSNSQDQVSPESNGGRVVKATVPIGGAGSLFLRLRVTRP